MGGRGWDCKVGREGWSLVVVAVVVVVVVVVILLERVVRGRDERGRGELRENRMHWAQSEARAGRVRSENII